MIDPYEVLGINSSASDEEIKSAYKNLVKKYHPDKYRNNPLADLAEQKMQEINEAYDILMKSGRSSASQYGQDSYNSASYDRNRQSNPTYKTIRIAIDRGDLVSAENLLLGLSKRDAEWFFLSGMISYKKGWFDDALSNINKAMTMDPNNREYRQVFQSMVSRNLHYNQRGEMGGYNSAGSPCDCCTTMLCLNCLCPGTPCC